MSTDRPLIFISYASPDRQRVLPHYEWLRREGFDAWIDCERILPGQNWDFEINLAIDRATLIVVFVSSISVQRRGYVQREVKRALERRRDQLVDDIFLIPVVLDGVDLPPELKSLHAISASDPDCKKRLIDSLQTQMQRLGLAVKLTQAKNRVTWTRDTARESWDGRPGYEFEIDLLTLQSDLYPNLQEASDCIRGEVGSAAMGMRACMLHQDPKDYPWEATARNEYVAGCGDPFFKGKVLSVQYTAHGFYVGAAHGNTAFTTFCFLLAPLVRIRNLSFIFEDPGAALLVVQRNARESLLAENFAESDAEPSRLDPADVERGTREWRDFDAFVFGPNGINLLFPPYQVGPYALGPQVAEVPYRELAELLKPVFADALEVDRGAQG